MTDIKAQRLAIHDNTGFYGNTVLFGKKAWDTFCTNPQVLDRIKYTSGNKTPSMMSREAAAVILEVDRVEVADMVYNTAVEGASADSFTNMFNKDRVLVCYTESSPGIMKASAGYCFSWRQYADFDVVQSRFRMDKLKADRIEGEIAYDFQQVAPDLGAMLIAVNT